MGYLVHILVALTAQGLAEEGIALEGQRPLLMVVVAALPYLLAAAARRASLRGHFRRAELLFAAQHGAAPVLFALAVCVFGWNTTLEGWLGFAPRLFDWPHPAVGLSFAPFLVYSWIAIDARVRALDTRPDEVRRARRFQVRLFASGLVPLALYVLIAWGVGSDPELRVGIEYVGVYGALFAALLLVLFLALLPTLLASTWDTESLRPGPLRDLLEALARTANFRCRDILLWRTGNRMANAAVVGIASRLRVVLLSDALIGQLQPRETLAVFAHEIGHARRHHVLIFVSWTAAFFLCVDLAASRWFPEGELAAAALLLVMLAVWYVGFGWMSRRFEQDADLYSVELTGDVGAMVQALEEVGGPHGRSQRSWRHFSTHDRVLFLRGLADDPGAASRLKRRIRTYAVVGALLAFLAAGAQAVDLARSFEEDRVVARLVLGRYAEAELRASAMDDIDEGLERRVQRAARIEQRRRATGRGPLDVTALEEEALSAFESGDEGAASDLLDLAALRGAQDLEAARDVLATRASGEEPDAQAWQAAARELDGSRPEWARLLERRAASGQ